MHGQQERRQRLARRRPTTLPLPLVLLLALAMAQQQRPAAAQPPLQQQQQKQQQQPPLKQQQQQQQRPAAAQAAACGGRGQSCCSACDDPGRTAGDDCSAWRTCRGGSGSSGGSSGSSGSGSSSLTCAMFAASASQLVPDGSDAFPTACLEQAPECGRAPGAPCCYPGDPTRDAGRCLVPGLACVVARVGGYGDAAHRARLAASPSLVRSAEAMGRCANVTGERLCGKPFAPCGAAGRRVGCPESTLACGRGYFCASPSDTLLGAPRCLPLPKDCGRLNGPCCPANMDGVTRERWLQDGQTPVPYCVDGRSMCVWRHKDFHAGGLLELNAGGSASIGGGGALYWDGFFARGYGLSRCAPLPQSCGNPGEPCCPSMVDQRLSGMVHNKRFKFQPCNYAAGGRVGIYCRGSWQASLLYTGEKLGVCTLNTADCGKRGKQCCREDIPETGSVEICEAGSPGPWHCDAGNTCVEGPPPPSPSPPPGRGPAGLGQRPVSSQQQLLQQG